MRKLHVFLIFTACLLFSKIINAQCPLSVGIITNPIGAVCRDVPVSYSVDPATGVGAINPQYVWVVNGDTVGSGSSISNTTPGDVFVYMTSDNCPDTANNNVKHDIVFFDVNTTTITEECNQTVADVEINSVVIYFGTEPYTYDLLVGDQNLGQQSLYSDLPVGNHPVYLTEAGGCTDTSYVVVTTLECDPPVPSQVMTPNGDGSNDMWYIGNINNYPNNEVYIFDRWGQRVYHKKDYDNIDGWEAKYVGADLPVSTYFYILEVKQEKSEDFVLKGAISIFR